MWMPRVQCCTGAREQVCLPGVWRVRSAELNGCAYRLKAKKERTFAGTLRPRNTTWSHNWPALFKTKDGATLG